MSATIALGSMPISRTHGADSAYASKAASSTSPLGRGTSRESRISIRSAYSTPSALSAATSSPLMRSSWPRMMWCWICVVASMTLSASSAQVSDCSSKRSRAASANGLSGWFRAKSGPRSALSAYSTRPSSVTVRSMTPPASRLRPIRSARSMRSRIRSRDSWVRSRKSRIVWTPACGRASRFTIIEWVIRMWDRSCSGVPASRFSNVCCDQPTWPSGAFFRLTFFCFFGSDPAFASATAFSISCSGACATT